MGLALHNPSESDFLPNLADHRYLPGRAGTEGLNPHAKHHRRPLSWSTWKLNDAQRFGESVLIEDHGPLRGSLPQDFPRYNRHYVTLARTNLRLNREYCNFRYYNHEKTLVRRTRNHWPKSVRQEYADAVNGGRALVSSSSEDGSRVQEGEQVRGRSRSGSRSRSNSPPTLDRQDAFRDPLTTKKRCYRTMSSTTPSLTSSEDAEVAELYRLGLLYDNEHERGSGFTFDALSHDEPVYRISTRPAKRGRKGGRNGQSTVIRKDESTQPGQLPLDLSYAMLSDDAELAAYLMGSESMSVDELPMSSMSQRIHSEESRNSRETPTVIYELLEDDDYSQEDTADEEDLMDRGFNNHGEYIEEEEKEEAWSVVNDSDSNTYEEEEDGYDTDAMSTDMIHPGQQKDAWINIPHPSDLTGRTRTLHPGEERIVEGEERRAPGFIACSRGT